MPTLKGKNVFIDGHRTSVKLEPVFWELLDRIGQREGAAARSKVVTEFVKTYGQSGGGHTSAVRTGIVTYFANAATELEQRIAEHAWVPGVSQRRVFWDELEEAGAGRKPESLNAGRAALNQPKEITSNLHLVSGGPK